MAICLTLGYKSLHDAHMDLGRISADQQVMGGVPCVTGTRIPVATVAGLAANGLTTDEILAGYPQLTPKMYRPVGYVASADDEHKRSIQNLTEGLTAQRAEELIAEIRADRDAR